MNKEEIIEILDRYDLKYSSQFIEFAMKFNSKDLVIEFCKYWKSRPVGGGDLNQFLIQNYKGKLGDK
jgi:hypothetical protein